MKKILFIISVITFIYACSTDTRKETTQDSSESNKNLLSDDDKGKTKYADDSKGIGKFTNIDVAPTLDNAMVERGTKIYDLKCSACHKLTNEKLVGPGWKGVTSRRKAEWVMNFATNTDEMLNKNAAAQALLEECLVRMPNQSLSDADARNIYEFMRKNDGVK